ncbi:MAG: Gfo/Idh/MocA family oxidoreductase [Planctomycetia bacterium]|nr:Gfo/Idh/MocA family oxidoreductase [Planctomycetia bacterium]
MRVLYGLILLGMTTLAMGEETSLFRIGVIGTDTSHVPAFVQLFNDPNAEGLYRQMEVTAAYKGGMIDNPDSWNRRDNYAEQIEKKGVKIYDSLEEMISQVDGILLESVDGRPHWEYAKPVLEAGKPLFIDKPMAGDLVDVVRIFQLAEKRNVPVFSASSLRYSEAMQKIRQDSPYGKTHGVTAWSPCSLNEYHPDFYWYGIHGVETLFTMMGPGCVSVSRTHTENYDLAVGVWEDGRIGTFRGIRKGASGYGGLIFGEKSIVMDGKYDGYKPLCDQIALFFEQKKSPIANRETLEIMAFMSAADESKKLQGKHVTLQEVLEKAQSATVKTFTLKLSAEEKMTLDDQAVTEKDLPALLALPADAENTYYRVILVLEKGVSQEWAQKVAAQLGDALLVRTILLP